MSRYTLVCDLLIEGDEPLEVTGADFFEQGKHIMSLKFKQEIAGISGVTVYKAYDGIIKDIQCYSYALSPYQVWLSYNGYKHSWSKWLRYQIRRIF